MLVSFALGDANFLRRPCTFHFFCVDFFALGSKRKPNSQWNIGGVGPSGVGAGVGHVHFMFFVLISFAFCSQRKPSFQWNMGLNEWTAPPFQQFLLCGSRATVSTIF